ncbi:MAG: TRL domain-containing protein [Candidatus Brocadiia bacterium]
MSITVRYLLLLALGTAGSFLGGCAGTEHVGVTPAKGFIFTHYRAPMNCRLEEAPGGPSGVPCGPDLKHGQTTAYAIILPILDTFHILSIGWGDAALDSAAQHGGIQTIYYSDYELLEILGIYKSVTIHIYGK